MMTSPPPVVPEPRSGTWYPAGTGEDTAAAAVCGSGASSFRVSTPAALPVKLSLSLVPERRRRSLLRSSSRHPRAYSGDPRRCAAAVPEGVGGPD
ncbi:hypothetical protein J4G37_01135 [Microvirga sp. 3-52]|nr:hypothetical protein [Microvirga sp. 3-52]